MRKELEAHLIREATLEDQRLAEDVQLWKLLEAKRRAIERSLYNKARREDDVMEAELAARRRKEAAEEAARAGEGGDEGGGGGCGCI